MASPEGDWLHTVKPDLDAPPDIEPLAEVLRGYATNPQTDNILVTGQQLLDIGAVMPAAQRQPFFAGVYGTLSTNMGHAIHHASQPRYSSLPRFQDSDTIQHTAHIFAGYYTRACASLVDYYRADTAEQRKQIYDGMDPHWRWVLFEEGVEDHTVPAGPNVELEAADPVQQFAAGGMFPHIVALDLGGSMVESDVPRQYLGLGGDYHRPVNRHIKRATVELAPHLVADTGNSETLVVATVMPAALMVAGLRRYIALPNYRKLKSAEDDYERARLARTMNERAVTMSKFFLRHGNLVLDPFDFFTGGGPVWDRFRKEQQQASQSGQKGVA